MTPAMKQKCPACGQILRVSEHQLSRTIRCSGCGHAFEPNQPQASSLSSIELYPAAEPVETVVNARLETQADGQPKVSPERPEQAPRTLGRFQLKKLLGQGGFGKVYLAFDPQLERNVAIKVLTATGSSQVRIQRFLVEAKSAARLRHPYIVPTFESGKEENRYYIASEFIEGSLLSDESTQRSLDERAAVDCIRKVATALAYAHERQVVHRDVKPQNIILDSAGDPHLMDFGLARRTDEQSHLTTDGAILGTPAYMSPEQARGEFQKVGPASDQYSLAVVLYQLLCGSTPFDGLPHLVVTQVAQGDVPSLRTKRPEISEDLAAICEKAMQKLPADRYSSCSAFADDLSNWLEGRPVAARPLSRFQKTLRLVAAHKTIAAMAAVTLMLLIVLVVNLWKILTTPGVDLNKVSGADDTLPAESQSGESVVVVSETDASAANESAGSTKKGSNRTKRKSSVAEPNYALAPFDSATAKSLQKRWSEYLKLPVEYTNTVGMKFVLIPPGEFLMGTSQPILDEHLEEVRDVTQWRECVQSEAPQHRVVLNHPYYIGVCEVTQKEYARVSRGAPSYFSGSGAGGNLVEGIDTQQLPVESVTWSDAVDFCIQLGMLERSAAPSDPRGALADLRNVSSYRLPTEAEWEFACAAGTVTRFWSGNTPQDLETVGWFRANDANHTQPVGQFPANPFGVHDMHGNVLEWVEDIWAPDFYSVSADVRTHDPRCQAPVGGPYVIRGGGYGASANHCRSAARHNGDATTRMKDLGFRVVLEIEPDRSRRNSGSVNSGAIQKPVAGAEVSSSNSSAVASSGQVSSSSIPAIAALNGQSAEIELLRQINVAECSYIGTWKQTPTGLESPAGNGTRIQIPYLPDGEYDLTLVVKPLEKKMGLTIGLVSAGHPFHAILDFYDRIHGLEQVNGLGVGDPPAGSINDSRKIVPSVLKPDEDNIVVCRVRKDGVTIEVNGEPLIAWKGSPEQLSRNGYWDMPIDRSLFLGGFNRFEFSRLTLKPVTGNVRAIPPWKLATPESRAIAAKELGFAPDAMERLAQAWRLALNDQIDNELVLNVTPQLMPDNRTVKRVTPEDIKLLATVSCPASVFLAGLYSPCWSDENLQLLAGIKNLKRLDVADPGAMPANFLGLFAANRTLRELVLDHQTLNEQQVTELCRIPTLRRLQLNFTDLSDESVRIIANSLPALESLHIGHMGPTSRLTNECVKAVSVLGGLKELSVRDSKTIDDNCLDDLLKLRNLTSLWIDGTSISQSGYERLKSQMPATMITWKP